MDGPCGSAVCINPLRCPKVSGWWEKGETYTLSTEDRGDTWALFGLTSLSWYFALGKETLCLVVGESGKSFRVGGLRGSGFWIMPYCRFIPQRGPGLLGGSQEFLQCFEHLETPSVLALRGILTYNLGLGHQGTHPAPFAEFDAWTRVCPFSGSCKLLLSFATELLCSPERGSFW